MPDSRILITTPHALGVALQEALREIGTLSMAGSAAKEYVFKQAVAREVKLPLDEARLKPDALAQAVSKHLP